MWIKFILVCTTIFFIVVLTIKRFIYFRPSFEFMAPRHNYQDIYEGKLHAWFSPPQQNFPIVLFCHGNGGNISHRQQKLEEFIKMGVGILIFDYSGYGNSRGVPSEEMCYANADMFYNYLLKKFSKDKIIPYGESLGGAVAMYISRKYNLGKIILESSIPSMGIITGTVIPDPFLGKICSNIFNEFNTVSFLTGYKGKSLVMHCVNDEIIPYNSISALKENATEFIDMEGTHNNPVIPWDKVKKFIFL